MHDNQSGQALDLIVLEEYERQFFEPDGGWREDRIARRTGKSVEQVYALLSEPRYGKWVAYGVSLRSGWLTVEGERKLLELRVVGAPSTGVGNEH